jgi:hypothetical protein
MPESQWLQQISQKESDKGRIALEVIKKPELLSGIIDGLGADKARVKYGCAKVLRIISDKAPGLLYPRIDHFIDLLDNDNNILKWEAIYVIANLAAVDTEGRFEAIFERYFAPIPGPALITAANVIAGAAKIALAKPHLADRIAKEMLKVEKAQYKTTECRNVALGHAIKAFDQFFDQIRDKGPVIAFVRRQLENTRNATRNKAEVFLKNRSD